MSVEMLTKRLHAGGFCCLEHRQRAPDVGLHRLRRILLQHRQVFERGGMEDDLRPTLGEDLPDPRVVANVGEHQIRRIQHGPALDGQLHRMQRGFVAVQHDQAAGFHRLICRHSSDPMDPPAPVTSTR